MVQIHLVHYTQSPTQLSPNPYKIFNNGLTNSHKDNPFYRFIPIVGNGLFNGPEKYLIKERNGENCSKSH